MQFALAVKGLGDAIASGDDIDAEADAKARALIGMCVEDMQLATINETETAKEAWDRLEDIFKTRSRSRLLMLRREVNTLKKSGGETLTAYVGRVKILRDELLSAGYPIDATELTWAMLNGLPRDYAMIVTVLQSSDDELDLDLALAKLLPMENRLESEHRPQLAMFAGQPARRGRYEESEGRNTADRGAKRCFLCKELGHMMARCPNMKVVSKGEIAL
jgi:hypothetical protein